MTLNTTYSEEELVDLLKQRDQKAFGYLYDNYSSALYSIVNAIVPEKEIANDVLQNVFVNIWKKIDSYDPGKGRLFTWMLNIARNASIDEVRSKGYKSSKQNQSIPDNVDFAGGITPAITNDVGLRKTLGKLKEEWRVLIDLSYLQGFTHEEISKALDIPLGTVKTRIRSALTQLRMMLS